MLPVRNASPTLKIMHQLKEKFRKIFEKVERWADGLIELVLSGVNSPMIREELFEGK